MQSSDSLDALLQTQLQSSSRRGPGCLLPLLLTILEYNYGSSEDGLEGQEKSFASHFSLDSPLRAERRLRLGRWGGGGGRARHVPDTALPQTEMPRSQETHHSLGATMVAGGGGSPREPHAEQPAVAQGDGYSPPRTDLHLKPRVSLCMHAGETQPQGEQARLGHSAGPLFGQHSYRALGLHCRGRGVHLQEAGWPGQGLPGQRQLQRHKSGPCLPLRGMGSLPDPLSWRRAGLESWVRGGQGQ